MSENTSLSDSPVILISGAAGGIGKIVAAHLLKAGYRCSLGAREVKRLENQFGEEDGARQYHSFDAFDPASSENWVQSCIAKFERIDGLINCAGLAERVTLLDDNDEALDRLWAVNVKAPKRLTRLCIPYLAKSGCGRIVNIASLAGKRVAGSATGYAMTKHAMIALTHSTRELTWDQGIRATALCSGWVKTDMALKAKRCNVKPEDMTQPEDVAELVQTLIELPNNAAVAELVVNCECEPMY